MSRIYSLLPCLAALALGGFCLFGPSLQAAPVINYAGQVAVDGDPFDGQGQFKFALVNADGNQTYWSNDGTSSGGSEPQAAVGAQVNGGLYSLLLGNTAIQNMAALDPSVFQAHPDVHLRVWFSDGVNGFQHLAPDRPFASVPYAFSAGSAPIQAGSITLDKLGPDVLADLNNSIVITRDMLPSDVLADLNRTIVITREMLPQEVLDDLDASIAPGSITAGMLTPGLLADLNASAPAGDGNGTAALVLPVAPGQSVPAGYNRLLVGKGAWSVGVPLPEPRLTFGATGHAGKLYVFGGNVENNQSLH